MSTPPGSDDSPESGNQAQPEPAPFDPYRFGKPDHPIPPEYAPPGYVPPPPTTPPAMPQYPPTSPYPPQQTGYGYPPPYPPPYGAPPPPNYHAYGAAPRSGNGKAIAALCLGIASIVLFWLTFLDAIPAILAVVFGILAIQDSGKRGGSGKAMVISGVVLGLLGAVAAIIFTTHVFHAIDKCGGIDSRNDPGFSQCLKDNL